jgi:CRISPR-associated protein Csm1
MWHKSYKDATVVVYSGGDDLFIMGEWSRVLGFAHEINKQCKAFFAEEAISISGGLSLVKEKFPIVRAAEYSAEQESKAKCFEYIDSKGKCYQKNALSIFDIPLRWDVEWSIVNKIYDKLSQLVTKQELVYRPIIRRILKYYDIVRFENKQITPLRQIWLMTYDLDRAIKRLGNAVSYEDKSFIVQSKNDIITGVTMLGESVDTPYHSLQLWAIAARLTELTIRKK